MPSLVVFCLLILLYRSPLLGTPVPYRLSLVPAYLLAPASSYALVLYPTVDTYICTYVLYLPQFFLLLRNGAGAVH